MTVCVCTMHHVYMRVADAGLGGIDDFNWLLLIASVYVDGSFHSC